MKRPSIIFLFIIFLLPVLFRSTYGQTADVRIQRLAGLARVWNTVKYFHPYLAERDIDWDKALVDAIPHVNTARTPEEYRVAVGTMLAVIGDNATFASLGSAPVVKTGDVHPAAEPIRLDNGILIIEITSLGRILGADVSQRKNIIDKTNSLLPQATGIVFDCRSPVPVQLSNDDSTAFFIDDLFHYEVTQVTHGSFALGSARYRFHNGYAPQSGTTSGGYYSSVSTDAPVRITGRSRTVLPISIIINDNAPDEAELFVGLRYAGLATIVQEGDLTREFSASGTKIDLTDGVTANIRLQELVNPDGSVGFGTDASVKEGTGDPAMKEAMAQLRRSSPRTAAHPALAPSLQSLKDKTYPEMKFPSPEYRLLGLFRFWGVINTFYPYRHLIDDTWGTVLQRYIPKFEADKDALEYQSTVRELATELHDSHGFVQNTLLFDERLGGYLPPVTLRYVEDKAVVVQLLDEKVTLKVGDVIDTIDGRPEHDVRSDLARYFAASTVQALLSNLRYQLLRGAKDSVVRLTVHTGKSSPRNVEINRTMSRFNLRSSTEPTFKLLPSGYGYVDLGRLQVGEVGDMFKTMMPTKAVIFDMRGYPNGTAWAIAPRLTDKNGVSAALFSRPFVSARSLNDADVNGTEEYSFRQPLPERTGEVYRGKVVMLIDESAISQAEHTCLFFESATNVTFIGTPTSGANGDVTNLSMPGGISINFSGQAVRHVDGRQLQRLGVQPTIRVAPTISGVAAGRDEVLDAAVKYLKGAVK